MYTIMLFHFHNRCSAYKYTKCNWKKEMIVRSELAWPCTNVVQMGLSSATTPHHAIRAGAHWTLQGRGAGSHDFMESIVEPSDSYDAPHQHPRSRPLRKYQNAATFLG